MQISLDIPDELAEALAGKSHDLPRMALEAVALEAYRQRRLSGYQLRTLLGIPSRFELDAFLKEHQVYDYTIEDFENDLATIRVYKEKQRADKPA